MESHNPEHALAQAETAAAPALMSAVGGDAAAEEVTRGVADVVGLVDGTRLTPVQKMLRDEIGFVAGAANIACAAIRTFENAGLKAHLLTDKVRLYISGSSI